jgi:hypothetical protein
MVIVEEIRAGAHRRVAQDRRKPQRARESEYSASPSTLSRPDVHEKPCFFLMPPILRRLQADSAGVAALLLRPQARGSCGVHEPK